jgi:hypothetical protein
MCQELGEKKEQQLKLRKCPQDVHFGVFGLLSAVKVIHYVHLINCFFGLSGCALSLYVRC